MGVICSITDADSIPGIKAFDIEIDPDEGLDAADIDVVLDVLRSSDDLTGPVVRVNIYGSSATDPWLLERLTREVTARLRGRGVEPAFKVHIPTG
jgi:hypothetical protein